MTTVTLRDEFDSGSFIQKHDGLKVLKPGTVGHGIASSLVELAYQAGRASAEADRKDAERYRWLRKDGNGFHFDGNADVGRFEVKQKTEPGTAIYHRGENLDAAIDTARASQEKA